MGATGDRAMRKMLLAVIGCAIVAAYLTAQGQNAPRIPTGLLGPEVSISWDWVGPPPAPMCGPGLDVGPGMRVYVQAVPGVSGDTWYICGANAAGAYELVQIATAP